MKRASDIDVVERAVQFILARVRRHRLEFCKEVGGHLFANVFGGDLRRYQANSRWERVAVSRIARDPRVGLSEAVLNMCIHVHLTVKRLGEDNPGVAPPELTAWEWDALWLVRDDPVDLLEMASWAETEKVPLHVLYETAALAGPFLAGGGRLADLIAATREGRRGRPAHARAMRLLRMVDGWVDADAGKMPAHVIERALATVDGMLEGLGDG